MQLYRATCRLIEPKDRPGNPNVVCALSRFAHRQLSEASSPAGHPDRHAEWPSFQAAQVAQYSADAHNIRAAPEAPEFGFRVLGDKVDLAAGIGGTFTRAHRSFAHS